MKVYIVSRVEFYDGEKTSEIVRAFATKEHAQNFIERAQEEVNRLRNFQPQLVLDPGLRIPSVRIDVPCYEVQEVIIEGVAK